MRRVLCFVLIILLSYTAYSQQLKGKVVDAKTSAGIPFANLYVNASTGGSISNAEGEFSLDVSDFNLKMLNISAVGYYSQKVSIQHAEDDLIIPLEPKVYALNEVVIRSNSLEKQRKKNMKIFKRELLGSSENARQCQILN
jgi:hypothetical protein